MSFRQGARQFFERRGAPTPALPYDAEVEYLQGDGNAYIDTGIYGTEQLVIDAKWGYESASSGAVPFGARTSARTNALAITGWGDMADNKLYVNYSNRGNAIAYSGLDVYQFTWDLHVENGNLRLYRDGVQNATNTNVFPSFLTVKTIPLFALWDGNTFYKNNGVRIYGFAVSEGGGGILDLIPVRFTNELGQPEGAMYDRVSGTLFRNAGTGAFTIGPDKS